MSNTVVKDCTPAPKPGDNALVIVVGEDGSLSVDPETLNNLLNKGGNSTEVNIVRMSGTDPENNTVDATLDTFFDTNANSTFGIETQVSDNNIMDALTVDVSEITRMCRNVQMDHCYTPLTSPSQKTTLQDNQRSSSSLVGMQPLNKSTEDLVAVLSEAEPTKIATKPPPRILNPTIPNIVHISKSNTNTDQIQILNTLAPSTVPKLTSTPTVTQTLVQTINKNMANLTAMSKKPLKIVTVAKPAGGIRMVSAHTPLNKPTLAIREPKSDVVVEKEPESTVENTELNDSKESVNDEDLSDISSESDFDEEDDSADSDFDAGRQKVPSKLKYKTFGSKRSNKSAPARLKNSQKPTTGRISAKIKRISTSKSEFSSKTPAKIGKSKTPRKSLPVPIPIEKEDPAPAIVTTPELPSVQDQAKQDLLKKNIKKKVVKPPPEIFDDGIALFSTPDVIRRVSTGGKSVGEMPDSPTKTEIRQSRTPSTDQRMDGALENKSESKENLSCTSDKMMKSSNESIIDNTKITTGKDTMNTQGEKSSKLVLNTDLKQLSGVDTACLETADGMGLDSAHLDLDLNTEELLPEDLLFQVAKLVENADIQKVIDTNLTLVDQNLESVLSKHENEPYVTKTLPGDGPTALPNSMKGGEKCTGDELPIQQQQSFSNAKILNQVNIGQQKSYIQSTSGIITKNTTNKPIQIVRPDGRVIIIPPIEKPATRSSKKKQGDDVPVVVAAAAAHTPPVPIAPPTIAPVIKQIPTAPTQPLKLPTVQKQSVIVENDRRTSTDVVPDANTMMPHGEDTEDSDSDESWKSEDDPDRLWCICKQPHNNRFMICCDTCEEWFHGQCVGVSKALGRQMEQQGKEWQCPNCQKIKKNALQQALNEAQAEMPLSPPVEAAIIDDSKTGPRCIVCKGPSRSESVYCSEKCIVQHSNTVERVIVFERATGRCLSGNNAPTVANLKLWLKQHPGFEVVSSGNKSLTQSKLQFTKTGKLTLQQTPKVVVKAAPTPSPKQVHILNHSNNEPTKQATPQKPISQQVFYGKQNTQPSAPKQQTYIIKTQSITKPAGQQIQQVKTAKLIQPHTIVIKQPPAKIKPPVTPTTPHPPPKPAVQEQITPKAKLPTTPSKTLTPATKTAPVPQKVVRQKSVSSTNPPEPEKHSPATAKGPEQLRENVRKTLAEHFTIRLKEQNEIKMKDEEVKNLSSEIEAELFSLFNRDTGAKYRNRYRSLIFNIKDAKNATLWKRICEKSVSPKELVRLSPEELASQELAQWREREAKHQLDMIKKSELDLLSCVRTYVLKSHKGEEVIEKRVAAVDSTIVADLDNSLNEEATADSTSERPRSQTSSTRETSRSKTSSDEKDKHRRDSNTSSSRHKSKSDEKNRDRSSRKHKDGSRDRKKRSRSRERHRDGSKEHKGSDGKRRHRSRSGSRNKSTDQDSNRRHKDRHDKNRHKSSSAHKHRHKDSESDSASSSTVKIYDRNLSKEASKSDTSDLLTMGLDKKSKEILESLVDNKVVPPLDDRFLKSREENFPQPMPAFDSESDHEPSSTVTIATPPRNLDSDVDKRLGTVPADMLSDTSPPDENSDANSEYNDKKSSEISKPLPPAPITSADGPCVWKGYINMVDVAKFRITAQEVSGDCAGLATELPAGLDIVGRISPDTVWEYLGKMRRSTAKFISILRLSPDNIDEHVPYHSLYTYLSSRKRFGVVKTANTSIKDFYIMPQASYNPLPQVLLPLSGPGFEEARPNLLLGILVSSKRKRSHIFSDTPPSLPKRMKESPPRSYTPPPSGARDPRASRHNLVSSIAMPPLPSVTPTPPPDLPKPEPPVIEDDMDEPYSPGDSDDALPSIAVNIISKPKIPQKIDTPIADKEPPAILREVKEPATDLSILEPFKTSNFSSIPGLDSTMPSSDSSIGGNLGVSSLLSSALASSLPANLDMSALVSASSNLTAELNSTDLEALQRNIDEINKRIERERQEIVSISQGIVQKEELGSSCLANIALPSNLQQILDSIKTTKKTDSPVIETDDHSDEYQPMVVASSMKTPSYTPSSSMLHKDPVDPVSDGLLSTIPLLLPKINTRTSTETVAKTSNLTDLTIPLNLPLPKRTLTHSPLNTSSPGSKRPAIDYFELSDSKRKHMDTSPTDKKSASTELSNIPLNFPLIKKGAVKKLMENDERKNSRGEDEFKDNATPMNKPSSVLSSLSTEELIRKANEMLAAQDDDKVEEEDEEEEAEDDDDEPYDPETSQPMKLTPKSASIKQAPVLYPNTSIPPPNMRYKPSIEQPPVPGMEDYE